MEIPSAGRTLLQFFFAWLGIFIWLRHVTLAGTLILALCLSLYTVLWLSYVRWLLPRIRDRAFPLRLFGFLGIAGFWVLLEYLRSFLIYGMPMGPLALSQWQNPVILQVLAWTGHYGLSFFLIFFNSCLAHTLYQMVSAKRVGPLFLRWFKIDFYVAILGLMALIFLYLASLPKALNTQEAFTFATMQPNFSPLLNWDVSENHRRMEALEAQLEQTQLLDFNLLLLPESVSPDPILGDATTRDFFEHWARVMGRPILTGNLAHMRPADIWYNGVFLIDAKTGLQSDFYAKRELVPFGEFTPEPFATLLEPFGAIQGSFQAGTDSQVIPIQILGQEWVFGPLVCYEDMFLFECVNRFERGQMSFMLPPMTLGTEPRELPIFMRLIPFCGQSKIGDRFFVAGMQAGVGGSMPMARFAANSVMKQIQFTLRGVATLSSVRS